MFLLSSDLSSSIKNFFFRLTGTLLQKIVGLLPNLRLLQVIRCSGVEESVLDQIKDDNPDLQVLKVCEYKVTAFLAVVP